MNHERLIHDIKKRKDKINMKENKLKGELSINRVYTKFIETKDGDNHFEQYHPITSVFGLDKKLRGRSEILIIRGNCLYLSDKKEGLCSYGDSFHFNDKIIGFLKDNDGKKDGFLYDVPGGGWMPDELECETAFREAREEARITTKYIHHIGDYIVTYNEPKEWIKKNINPEDQWSGYYTSVYVGLFDSFYDGYVNDNDKDEIIKTGMFYPIRDVYDKLNPIHQFGINMYSETMDMPNLKIE